MSRRAFSLLEVMVTLGVVGLLAGSVFGFLLDLLRARDVLEQASIDSQTGSAIIERLESDLLGAAVDVEGQAGITGDATSLRVTARAVAMPIDASGVGDGVTSDVRYDDMRGRLEARRSSAGRSPGAYEIVSDRVQGLRLRYFDGRRWVSSFDSLEAGSLPVAIEVAAWFGEVEVDETIALEGPEAHTASLMLVDATYDAPAAERPLPWREPDLLRVIAIPDGPTAAWREAR